MSKDDFKITSMHSLTENMPLPPVEFCIARPQLFMFSAITWNRHRIHYDTSAARADGHPDVLVHRGLIGNLFVRYISSFFPSFFISQIDWRVLHSVSPDEFLSCIGQVISITDEEAELQLMLKSTQDAICAESTAVIRPLKKTDFSCPKLYV
jgi:hydroxyacyl-ACP dehydratase HTD2-like protein with hotdog domain